MKSSPRVSFPAALRCFAALLLSAVSALAADNQAAWFQSNPAWSAVDAVTPVADGAQLQTTPGTTGEFMVIRDAGAKAPQLRSKAHVADCVVSFDYLYTTGTETAVFLASAYRLRLDGDSAGTLGPMVGREGEKDSSIAPVAAAAAKPGTWHRVEARLRAMRRSEGGSKIDRALVLEAKIDGVIVQSNTLIDNWCRGTETEWETTGGNVAISAAHGSVALRNFSVQRAHISSSTIVLKA